MELRDEVGVISREICVSVKLGGGEKKTKHVFLWSLQMLDILSNTLLLEKMNRKNLGMG